jgi:hypothetical protein
VKQSSFQKRSSAAFRAGRAVPSGPASRRRTAPRSRPAGRSRAEPARGPSVGRLRASRPRWRERRVPGPPGGPARGSGVAAARRAIRTTAQPDARGTRRGPAGPPRRGVAIPGRLRQTARHRWPPAVSARPSRGTAAEAVHRAGWRSPGRGTSRPGTDAVPRASRRARRRGRRCRIVRPRPGRRPVRATCRRRFRRGCGTAPGPAGRRRTRRSRSPSARRRPARPP